MEGEDEIQVDGFEDVAHTSVTLKDNFYPWHKPRKQYIRLEQWNASIRSLIRTLDLVNVGRPLEYLSLPGPDLLDVRALYPICESENVKLKFTGLNHISQEEKALLSDQLISLDELRNRDFVDVSSDVYLDKLESLAKKGSVAYQKILDNSVTYDVVNIDLCDSLVGAPPLEVQDSYYDALFTLLRHQADKRDRDWLFFVTSRTNLDMVNPQILARFVEALETLFEVDDQVFESFIKANIFPEGTLEGKKILRDMTADAHSKVVVSGIGKWVLGALLSNAPSHKSKMMKPYLYDVSLKEGCGDMYSLAFWCTKVPAAARDPLGLANGINLLKESIPQLESKACRHIAASLSSSVDVDVKMIEDGVFDHYLKVSAELMKSARYDPVKYIAWAELEQKNVVSALARRQ